MSGAPPLHALFQALREAGLPLGVSSYLALLAALRMGEGADREALFRLCRMLWTSSPSEGLLLERLFRDFVPARLDSADFPPELLEEEGPSEKDLLPPGSAAGDKAPAILPDTLPVSPSQATSAEKGSLAAPPPSLRALEIAAAAVQGMAVGLDFAMGARRHAPGEYLPVTPRQLGQSWRRLRRMEARGPRTELDVTATLAAVARSGIWTGPVLTARKVNVASLLLLVDRDGSMTPFLPLTRRILESASHASLGGVEIAYFHNYAAGLVDLAGGPAPLAQVLARLPISTGVLLVSDAGAARRTYVTERIEGTRRMLANIAARLRRIAWINPVPRPRWLGTSAQEIEAMVPMFEATRTGVDAALRVLRGRRPFAGGPSPQAKP